MKKIVVFLADGFEEIEAIATVDVLLRAGFEVKTVSISAEKSVLGAHKIAVLADHLLAETDFSQADCLVLPGGMPGAANLNENSDVKRILTSHFEQGKTVAAICAAPLVFGNLGFLQGKNAVCYPGFEEFLHRATICDQKAVADGNVITGKGPGCVFDFALKIVEHLAGKSCADEVKRGLLWE